MNPLSILQAILSLAPAGIHLTQEAISLVGSIHTAIDSTPGSIEHTAAVTAINNHAAKTTAAAAASVNVGIIGGTND